MSLNSTASVDRIHYSLPLEGKVVAKRPDEVSEGMNAGRSTGRQIDR